MPRSNPTPPPEAHDATELATAVEATPPPPPELEPPGIAMGQPPFLRDDPPLPERVTRARGLPRSARERAARAAEKLADESARLETLLDRADALAAGLVPARAALEQAEETMRYLVADLSGDPAGAVDALLGAAVDGYAPASGGFQVGDLANVLRVEVLVRHRERLLALAEERLLAPARERVAAHERELASVAAAIEGEVVR